MEEIYFQVNMPQLSHNSIFQDKSALILVFKVNFPQVEECNEFKTTKRRVFAMFEVIPHLSGQPPDRRNGTENSAL